MKNTGWVIALCTAAGAAHAEDYNLFNPVPDDKLRPMSTERPSKTDSAITLDAGRFQIETSLVNYNYNSDCIAGSCSSTREWGGGTSTNLRIGLTESADFQILFDAYRDVNTTDKSAGTHSRAQGFGDTTLRYKYNFWGNDGGKSALATVLFMKLPTNNDNLANDDVEGGIEFPFVLNFDDGWSLGGMTALSVLNEQSQARDYYLGYTNSLILGKSLNDTTSVYGEFFTYLPDTGTRDWQNSLDFGIVHKLSDNVQIDTGINFGVTDAATDVQWFAGIAYRF